MFAAFINNLACSVLRITQFHSIYDNKRHVITVTYFKKRKYLEVRLNKAKDFVRGYLISFLSFSYHFDLLSPFAPAHSL